jgi:RNA recognition motif-containing protein
MNIYISNLSFSTESESLQKLFAEYGEVTSANIITDRETGRSRGFGFVEMPNEAEAQKAIDELNNTDFEGKTITVNIARPKTERRNNGGFNRGGSGFNRGGGGGGYGRNRY